MLRKGPVPAVLVTHPSNIRYLTGLDASEAVLVVQKSSAALCVDARYAAAARTVQSSKLSIRDRSEIVRVLANISRCGYEEDHLTTGRLRRWKRLFKNTKFVHTSGLVEGLRRKKDDAEIVLMKRALSITNAVLGEVPAMLRPGISEAELSAGILIASLDRDADGLSFDTIVAFGPSSSEPHHRTGARKLRARDIVQIDMGARYKGYCSDRSEVFFIGEPTREQRRIYDAVLEAKIAAKKLVKAGSACVDIDRAARSVLREHKVEEYFTHSLGHGLGLDIHEGVSLSPRTKETLRSGDVVTVEPGVYLPGKFGIRLEDTVFVK